MTSIKNLTPKNIFSRKIYGTNGCNWAKNTIMDCKDLSNDIKQSIDESNKQHMAWKFYHSLLFRLCDYVLLLLKFMDEMVWISSFEECQF